ncbi:MAG: methylenetetrahydrofolate reductase, partial [Spirochaetota bacterium]
DAGFLLSSARLIRLAGADIITIADSPLSRTRADSIMLAAKVKRETGAEVMPHLSCRDRNHIAVKGALLGAAIENISAVLAITGDPLPQSGKGEKGVFSFNSFSLMQYIQSLNSDVFTAAPFIIGGALNVSASNFDIELKRAEKKTAQGASFLMTQPLFSRQSIQNFLKAKKRLACTLLAGILPIAGYRNALFLNNEVSGISIPDEIIEKLKDTEREEAAKISLSFCRQIIDAVFAEADGFYIMTPLKRTDLVAECITYIRKK